MILPVWGRRAIACVSWAIGLSACTNESPSLRIISVIPPASAPISFSSDVQVIFTRSCAKTFCHAGSSAPFGLSLERGQAYANLVGVPSAEVVTLQRVEPGRSDLSYLVDKIEGSGLGSRMPADGPPFLPDVEIQLIKDWIDQGAPNN